MPVSPQDFELYSRMTGAPMPTDAMSRMQMAPDVYNFTKNFARKPNILEKTGNLVKNIGRGAVMALGAPLVAASEAENARMQEQLRNKADIKQSEAVTMDNPVGEVTSEPLTAGERLIDKKMKMMERQAEIDQALSDDKHAKAKELLAIKSGNIQQPTTADAFGQDLIENQTADNVIDKKMEQGSQIADSTRNVAEVLSESQDSMPASMFRPIQIPTTGALHAATPIVGEGLSKSGNEVNVIKGVEEEVVGSGATSDKVKNFLKKMGGTDEGSKLDAALLAAMQDRDKKERFYLGANSGDPSLGDSPLLDHPDVIGGEDDASLPGGTNTSPTQDLSSFHKEMRKMDAMERNKGAIDEVVDKFKNMSPSERQTMLGTEGMDSPNEMQGRITAAEESSNKLIDVMRSMKGDPTQEQFVEVSKAGSRAEQKIAAKQRLRGIKTPLTEKLYPSDVARTDIQVGGMVDRKTGLGKSVGISYTPMNGDTKVGFNIMSDPTKPTEVSTFDFVAPPDTMQSLESREDDSLGTKSFGKLFNIARQKKQGFSGLEM